MTKPKITITIDGRQGSGKSTLAQYLATDLKIRHGVDVSLNDDGQRQPVPDVHETLGNHFDADVVIIVEKK